MSIKTPPVGAPKPAPEAHAILSKSDIKKIEKAEETLKVAAKVTSTVRNVASIVGEFQTISKTVSKGLKLTKGPSIALLPWNMYGAYEDLAKITETRGTENWKLVKSLEALLGQVDDPNTTDQRTILGKFFIELDKPEVRNIFKKLKISNGHLAETIHTLATKLNNPSVKSEDDVKEALLFIEELDLRNLFRLMEEPITMKEFVKKKIRLCLSLLIRLDSVIDSIASTCGIVYAFKAVSTKLVDWIPIFNIVSFFVGFISIGTAGESVVESGKLFLELRELLKGIEDSAKSDRDKAIILADFLDHIKKVGIEPLLKKLMISRKATFHGEVLTQKVHNLATNLLAVKNQTGELGKSEQTAADEAIELIKKLAPRVKVDLGLKVLDLSTKVANTVAKAFITFTPLPVVGYAIMATTGIVSLLTMGGLFLFVNKKPFDTDSTNNAWKLVSMVSGAVSHLRDRLKVLALAPQKFAAMSS